MDARFSQAAGAYQDALRAAQNIIAKTGGSAAASEESFAVGKAGGFLDMVGHSLKESAALGYKSEAVATKALAGKAELTDVVTAIASAENALNTVVAIRDKVINAYQDIIKMPI